MKKCPFCSEMIQDEAIKCRFCNEFLSEKPKDKWYFKAQWLVIGFLGVGPFILPLLWVNPHFSVKKKIIVTLVIMILTYALTIFMVKSVESIKNYYQLLSS